MFSSLELGTWAGHGRPWRLRSCRMFSGWKSGDPGTGIWSQALEVSDVFGHDGCHQLFGGSQILHEAGSTDQEGGAHGFFNVFLTPKLNSPAKKPKNIQECFLKTVYVHVTCHFVYFVSHKVNQFPEMGIPWDPSWEPLPTVAPSALQEFFRPSACGLEPELVELPGKECVHLSKAMAAGLQRQLDLRMEIFNNKKWHLKSHRKMVV